MNWFKGSIPEAIVASRQRKCIFVVVVTADDDNSSELLKRLEEQEVSQLFNEFVTILLKNGTTEAHQFSQLYPLVVMPSIYMIGIQGTPLEVIGGLVDSPTLIKRTKAALDLHQSQQTPEKKTEPAGDAVVPKKKADSAGEAVVPDSTAGEGTSDALPLEARVERANELLAAVREKKAQEEREKEKEKEKERRELGKQLKQLKDAQQEREQREIVESRQKEKREEKEALEKIRQQIAQDRADRAARYQAYQGAQAEEEARKKTAQVVQEQLAQEKASAVRNAFARIQFRLPDGSTRNEQFESNVPLSRVFTFIDEQICPPFRPYCVCTTFPRRQFSSSNMNETLLDLGLAPSAALLIVPTPTASASNKPPSSVTSWFSSIIAPLFWLWNWIWLFLFPPTQAIQPPNPEPSSQRAPQGVRRRRPEGNRLADGDDDNATWNGNSTQQL